LIVAPECDEVKTVSDDGCLDQALEESIDRTTV